MTTLADLRCDQRFRPMMWSRVFGSARNCKPHGDDSDGHSSQSVCGEASTVTSVAKLFASSSRGNLPLTSENVAKHNTTTLPSSQESCEERRAKDWFGRCVVSEECLARRDESDEVFVPVSLGSTSLCQLQGIGIIVVRIDPRRQRRQPNVGWISRHSRIRELDLISSVFR